MKRADLLPRTVDPILLDCHLFFYPKGKLWNEWPTSVVRPQAAVFSKCQPIPRLIIKEACNFIEDGCRRCVHVVVFDNECTRIRET